MEMKTHKIRDTIFLFLTAMIWGAAFVAQSVSMDYIGPFTFICLRSVIGGLFLIPVIMVIDNIRKKRRSARVKTASDNGINSFQKMQAEEEKLSWKNKRLLDHPVSAAHPGFVQGLQPPTLYFSDQNCLLFLL